MYGLADMGGVRLIILSGGIQIAAPLAEGFVAQLFT